MSIVQPLNNQRKRTDGEDARVEESIPRVGYSKDRYDPEHSDADWGGMVNRTFKKRLFQDHNAARSQLIPSKGGLLPALQDTNRDRASSKRIFDKDIKFCSVETEAPKGTPFHSAVHQMGPGGRHDCTEWKTSYAAQSELKPVADKLAPGRVKILSQESHRRLLESPHEQSSQSRSTVQPGNLLPKLPQHEPHERRREPRIDPRRSMLAGIGHTLAASDTLQTLANPTLHMPSGFDNPANKSLLIENHHNVLLGYTGQRRDK
ncbi:hypothetical protein LEN26_000293 [Aphanomyces euteiches]|nr:hypothetical protein AeMF1_002484 [Aphanomyces euteiches]KAH9163895.1 hypothetical protein LEN26_000293 [Aphanomyces euteiches]KAH9187857.1 hypothetical protein AeNC1_010169 [Aphanomyces euteiches]